MPTLDLLQRALEAEEKRDELQVRIADLESRLKSALNADPTTATRALSWISRAETSEGLVHEIVRHVAQRALTGTQLPPGWLARAEAQLRSVKILRRDMEILAEKPSETWADYTERASGRRSILRDP